MLAEEPSSNWSHSRWEEEEEAPAAGAAAAGVAATRMSAGTLALRSATYKQARSGHRDHAHEALAQVSMFLTATPFPALQKHNLFLIVTLKTFRALSL